MNAPLRSRSENERSPRRLIFVNRYYRPDLSATSQMLTDLAESLGARGYAVEVVCSRQLYDAPGARLPAEAVLDGVRVHRVATTRFGRVRLIGRAIDYVSFYVAASWAVWRRLGRGDTLIVKTDPPMFASLAAPLVRLRGAVLINWLQDVFPEVASRLGANPLPGWLDALLRRWRNATLCAAAANVVIGERMREHLISCGVSAAQIAVIDNWADDRIEPRAAAASTLRRSRGLAGRFVIGYSGNLGRAHEIDTLIGAAKRLGDDASFAFLMIGGGAKMSALRTEVACGALNGFVFLPYQPREELADSLAAADVHLVSLLPDLEGLIVPSKLFGILAAGRPCVFIGDSRGEVARILGQSACGFVVQPGDAAGLVAAIRTLRDDPEECRAMGGRARAAYLERYSRDAAVLRWLRVLDSDAFAGSAPSGLEHLQIDEQFVGGAHSAIVEAGVSIEKSPAHEVQVHEHRPGA
ncbi:MAG: glycosyltransferase family 4 protein [Gammaproteobacteria bacterium]|nr:glycosyltransferase family 4 protein [Gammaproteobacteria bacterium]